MPTTPRPSDDDIAMALIGLVAVANLAPKSLLTEILRFIESSEGTPAHLATAKAGMAGVAMYWALEVCDERQDREGRPLSLDEAGVLAAFKGEIKSASMACAKEASRLCDIADDAAGAKPA